jgi:hypothetical protein
MKLLYVLLLQSISISAMILPLDPDDCFKKAKPVIWALHAKLNDLLDEAEKNGDFVETWPKHPERIKRTDTPDAHFYEEQPLVTQSGIILLLDQDGPYFLAVSPGGEHILGGYPLPASTIKSKPNAYDILKEKFFKDIEVDGYGKAYGPIGEIYYAYILKKMKGMEIPHCIP